MDTLDTIFLNILDAIQRAYVKLPRSLQIRIELWCTKLSEECIPHDEWRKNRNYYALYLYHCILKKEFKEPFHHKPTGESLGKLPAYIILSLPKFSSFLPSVPPSSSATKESHSSGPSASVPVSTENNGTDNISKKNTNEPVTTAPSSSQPSASIKSRPRQVTRWDPIISNVIGKETIPNTDTDNANIDPSNGKPSSAAVYPNILLPTHQHNHPPFPSSTTVPVSRGRKSVPKQRQQPKRTHHHQPHQQTAASSSSSSPSRRPGIMFHPRNTSSHHRPHRSRSNAPQPSVHSSLSSSLSSSEGWRDESFDASSITSSVISRHERDASYLRSDKEEMDRRIRIANESRQSSLSSRSKVRFANGNGGKDDDDNHTNENVLPSSMGKIGIERALIDAQQKINELERELQYTKKQLRTAQEELRRSYHQRETNEKRIYQLENQIQQCQTQIQSLTTYILELRTENQTLQQQYNETVTKTQTQHEQNISVLKQQYTEQINVLKQQIGNKFLRWILNKENGNKDREMEELFTNNHVTAEEEQYIDENDDIVTIPQSSSTIRSNTMQRKTHGITVPSLSSSFARIRKESSTGTTTAATVNKKELEALLGTSSDQPDTSSSSSSFTSPTVERTTKKDDSPVTPLTFFSTSPPTDTNELLRYPYPSSASSPVLPEGTRIESLTESLDRRRIGRSGEPKGTITELSKSVSISTVGRSTIEPPPSVSSTTDMKAVTIDEGSPPGPKVPSKGLPNKKKPSTFTGKELPPRPSLYNVFPLEKVLPYPYSSVPPPPLPSVTTTTVPTLNPPSVTVLISPTLTDTSFLSSNSTVFTSTSNGNDTDETIAPKDNNQPKKAKGKPQRWSGQLASIEKQKKETTVSSTARTTTTTTATALPVRASIPVTIGKESSVSTDTSSSTTNAYGYETNPPWNEPIIPLQIPYTIPYGLR